MDRATRIMKDYLKTPIRQYSREEAQAVLRECGVLTKDNNLAEAYKDIVIKIGNHQDEDN